MFLPLPVMFLHVCERDEHSVYILCGAHSLTHKQTKTQTQTHPTLFDFYLFRVGGRGLPGFDWPTAEGERHGSRMFGSDRADSDCKAAPSFPLSGSLCVVSWGDGEED